MAVTKLQDATWRAQEAINHVVEADGSFEEKNLVLERLRKHIDARIEQTRPDGMAFADLLGGWTE